MYSLSCHSICTPKCKLTDGSSTDEQLEFMQDKCAQAAELLGFHKKARQVQPREYIAGNKRLMSAGLAAQMHASIAPTAVVGTNDSLTEQKVHGHLKKHRRHCGKVI